MVHPPEETLRRFGKGDASPAENREVVAHLLRRCNDCAKIVRETIEHETPPAEDELPSLLMILHRVRRSDRSQR